MTTTVTRDTPGDPVSDQPVQRGSGRVLALSTSAFTVMFAVWLMFGVLGIPIRREFGLTDVQLSWITSVAVLNGSIWRLFTGIAADRCPGRGRPLGELLRPLGSVRVWRFSLYYVVVFGAYVALSAWLPKYYVDVYDQSLSNAALLTATFIFPASLLRPVGGWLSDRFGARRIMYLTFAIMLAASGALMMPYGHIELVLADATTRTVLPWSVGLPLFVVLVFVIGVAMGVGKAAVYKHIPEYFPHDVGAVGGVVGMLGGLGGFFLPPVFAYLQDRTGQPQSTFGAVFVATGLAAVWMHVTVYRLLHQHTPHLADTFEHPAPQASGSAPATPAPTPHP